MLCVFDHSFKENFFFKQFKLNSAEICWICKLSQCVGKAVPLKQGQQTPAGQMPVSSQFVG